MASTTPYVLRLTGRHQTGKEFSLPLGEKVVFGRQGQGAFLEGWRSVSRQHFILTGSEAGCVIENLGAPLRVHVGSQRHSVKQHETRPLSHGDRIMLHGIEGDPWEGTVLMRSAGSPSGSSPASATLTSQTSAPRSSAKEEKPRPARSEEKGPEPSAVSAAAAPKRKRSTGDVLDEKHVDEGDSGFDVANYRTQRFAQNLKSPAKKQATLDSMIKTKAEPVDEPPEDTAGQYSIAFPAISIDEHFQYDPERGGAIARHVILEFLRHHTDPNLCLVMVELPAQAPQISNLFRSVADADPRFVVFTGTVADLHAAGRPCWYSAAPTNWRLQFHSPFARALTSAVPSFEKKLPAKSASAGQVYSLEVPRDAPLRQQHGVHYILSSLAPSMNSKFSDNFGGDYQKGNECLATCYRALLKHFYAATKLPAVPAYQDSALPIDASGSPVVEDVKMEADDVDWIKFCPADFSELPLSAVPVYKQPPSTGVAAPGRGNWQDALKAYLAPTEHHRNDIFCRDQFCVVIYDKFPKSRFHLLLLPVSRPGIHTTGPSDLTNSPGDTELLEQMKKRAEWINNGLISQNADKQPVFRFGFHAVPSMNYLHLHIISQDFDSPYLKNKKHWNTFTTDFFIDIDAMQTMVADGSNRELTRSQRKEYQAKEEQELRCHLCKTHIRTIPALKEHIKRCAGR